MPILCKSKGAVRRVLDSRSTRQCKGDRAKLAKKLRPFAIPVLKTKDSANVRITQDCLAMGISRQAFRTREKPRATCVVLHRDLRNVNPELRFQVRRSIANCPK